MNRDEIAGRMLKTKVRLDGLRHFLSSQGYRFQYPEEVMPGPDSRSRELMARIEDEVGPIPAAVRQFYEIVGSVNFNGYHEQWSGCEYPDALIIFPAAYAEQDLADFLLEKEEWLRTYGSFRIPIAPDYYHKEGVSGGMWYGVPIPAATENPQLLEEPHNTTFLEYLEIALHWGGFPGLEKAHLSHTWPLEALRRAAA